MKTEFLSKIFVKPMEYVILFWYVCSRDGSANGKGGIEWISLQILMR